jgi:hypothetical protein
MREPVGRDGCGGPLARLFRTSFALRLKATATCLIL